MKSDEKVFVRKLFGFKSMSDTVTADERRIMNKLKIFLEWPKTRNIAPSTQANTPVLVPELSTVIKPTAIAENFNTYPNFFVGYSNAASNKNAPVNDA